MRAGQNVLWNFHAESGTYRSRSAGPYILRHIKEVVNFVKPRVIIPPWFEYAEVAIGRQTK